MERRQLDLLRTGMKVINFFSTEKNGRKAIPHLNEGKRIISSSRK